MEKYIVGSKVLDLQGQHDVDYLVLIDGKSQDNLKCDFHVWFEEDLREYLQFQHTIDTYTALTYSVLYQCDRDLIGADFPIEYHILDFRDKYIELLQYIVENKACNFVRSENLNQGKCAKRIYHIAYITFILLNNSTTLTAEQKEIVQKIHDRRMPQEYLDELEAIIRSLI